MIIVVISEWLMCLGMGFFKMGGTKADLKFLCIMKGRATRREGWLQGRSENKEITLINRVGQSTRPFLCNHQ